MNEYDKLIKIIDQYEVISFDIFDTLLLRNVQEPKDIFKILAKYVKDKYKILDFANIRIKAEERSRTEANKYETSLKEIYEYIDIDEKIKEDIKLKELELEEKFLRANPFMQKIYNYCLEKKKKVICITDMYLPLEFLEKILKKNGYNKVKIYLSCYYHKHKGNMTLYDEVQKEENIAKDKWLHIGDNHFSDYDKAIEFGIHAYHYQRIRERSALPKAESLGASIIWSIASNEALNGLDISYWSKFGILYASSIYFGFTNWLYNKLKDQDNIYFLARDGYIIEKVFAKFKKITKLNITTKYLYTSRRAIQLPMEYFHDKTEAINTLTCVNTALGQKLNINDIFNYFKLDINKYKDILNKYHFQENELLDQEEDFILYRQMISEIYLDIKDAMEENIDLIKEYLKQEGFDQYKRINVVDIGWRGSVQEALKKVCKSEIFGYYLATSFVYPDIYYNTQGYLLNYNLPNDYADAIYPNIPMYEFLFSSKEGSLLGFKKENNKIVPLLSKNNSYAKEIEELQEKALDIIDKYLEYYEYLDDLKPIESITPYEIFLKQKNYNDLVMFNKLKTEIGYGNADVSYVKSYKKENIEDNYEEFKEEIAKSLWNNTFLVDGLKEEEYLKYKDKLKKKEKKIFTMTNFKKALKNPSKAIQKIKNIILKR